MTRPDRVRATFLQYAGAVAAVLVAWLARIALSPTLNDHALYVTFVGAVLITMWLSGLGPGLVALVLSVLTIMYAFLPPIGSLFVSSPIHAIGLALFVVVVAICIGVTEALRAMHEARGAALRLSDERFRHLTEAIPSIVWTAAPDGSISYANEQWLEYIGVDRDT